MLIGATRFLGDRFGAFALLLASSLAPLRAFADAGELLKADQGVWMGHDNGFRDAVIRLQFQPSLSPAERDFAPRCGASAFLLQAFLEAGVAVSFPPATLCRVETAPVA